MGRDGQVSALALFSEELRRARAAAGLAQDQLADRVGYSASLVAHAGLGGRFAIASFDGPADVAYLGNALAGQGAERAEEVARLALRYDILKAEALSPACLGRPGEEGDREMDLTRAPWRKSSYSGGNGGACVEVAVVPGSKEGSDYVITMRDSKDPDGPVLTFTPDEWKAFTLGVQDGEFDVEEDSAGESGQPRAGG